MVRSVAVAVLICLVSVGSIGVAAQQQGDVRRVSLTAGRSTVLMTDYDITRIAITDPAIADAVVVQPREVLIDGKAAKIPPDQAEKGLLDSVHGQYRWDEETGWIARGDQDRCAQESQGAIFDRTQEHLGVSDEGVILLRKMFKQSIEAVQRGEDPVGIIRDPAKNQILRWVPAEFKLEPKSEAAHG